MDCGHTQGDRKPSPASMVGPDNSLLTEGQETPTVQNEKLRLSILPEDTQQGPADGYPHPGAFPWPTQGAMLRELLDGGGEGW